MYFDTPVTINEVTATSVRKIKYSPDYFNFGNVQHDKDTVKDLGFAGFKVLYPINSKDKNDEIVSMLGASYFRVLGQGQVYGLSARGGYRYRAAVRRRVPAFSRVLDRAS